MLTKVANLSPGDVIATASGGGKIKSIEVTEDGSTLLEYFEGPSEWLLSGNMVVKKDEKRYFFQPDPVL